VLVSVAVADVAETMAVSDAATVGEAICAGVVSAGDGLGVGGDAMVGTFCSVGTSVAGCILGEGATTSVGDAGPDVVVVATPAPGDPQLTSRSKA
jgi:hypothetical protein